MVNAETNLKGHLLLSWPMFAFRILATVVIRYSNSPSTESNAAAKPTVQITSAASPIMHLIGASTFKPNTPLVWVDAVVSQNGIF